MGEKTEYAAGVCAGLGIGFKIGGKACEGVTPPLAKVFDCGCGSSNERLSLICSCYQCRDLSIINII